MPNIKSAIKRARQNEKKKEINRSKKSSVRTAEKSIRKAVQEKNMEAAVSFYQKFTALIDKAAKTNIYHKNTASRKKSRLAKLIAVQRQSE